MKAATGNFLCVTCQLKLKACICGSFCHSCHSLLDHDCLREAARTAWAVSTAADTLRVMKPVNTTCTSAKTELSVGFPTAPRYTRDGDYHNCQVSSTAVEKVNSSRLLGRATALQHTVFLFVCSCTEELAIVIVSGSVKQVEETKNLACAAVLSVPLHILRLTLCSNVGQH